MKLGKITQHKVKNFSGYGFCDSGFCILGFKDNYLYCMDDWENVIWILDPSFNAIKYCKLPKVVYDGEERFLYCENWTNPYFHHFFWENNYLYLIAEHKNRFALVCYDITTPDNPELKYYHVFDTYVSSGDCWVWDNPFLLLRYQNYLYVVCEENGGLLAVIDFSSPFPSDENITKQLHIPTNTEPPPYICSGKYWTEDTTFIYEDKLIAIDQKQPNVYIYDLSTPSSPDLINTVSIPTSIFDDYLGCVLAFHTLLFKNCYLFFPCDASDLIIFNAENYEWYVIENFDNLDRIIALGKFREDFIILIGVKNLKVIETISSNTAKYSIELYVYLLSLNTSTYEVKIIDKNFWTGEWIGWYPPEDLCSWDFGICNPIVRDNTILFPLTGTSYSIFSDPILFPLKTSIQRIAGLAVKSGETWNAVLDAGIGQKDVDQGILGSGPYIFDEEKTLWQPTTSKFSTLTILNKVSSVGRSDSFELPRVFKNYAWEIIVEGSPDNVEVDLEGSIDGENWFIIDTSYTTSKEVRYVSDKQIAYVKANLITLEGGSNPTVTVIFRGGASNV